MNIERIIDERLRMGLWLIVTIILCAAIYALAPQQLGVSLYKLSLITMGGYVGYWIDRGLFYYARPDWFLTKAGDEWRDLTRWESWMRAAASAMLRRSVIVGSCILAAGLGT